MRIGSGAGVSDFAALATCGAFEWMTRFPRQEGGYEIPPQVLSELHTVAFAIVMLIKIVGLNQSA
jgi:hypothetical protein